ncbi:4'-phosphopantetheinyl transferase family protein [Yeosuana marina]|uniref:4'-phosphopantetheinyl transferase family protein n=1 Tax=Yeosuana marina TaxID=1565536 RepID=UPI00141DC94B|nr:4'-phosphopantetheinyl transferase superfamily protein [Yeosuana marina]
MIGNDIVDLNTIKPNWNRKRFLDKVFTEKEQHIISVSENQHQTLWLLWSMKEAAYKIYVQQFGKQFFNPKKLVCYLSSSTSGYITIENETYTTTSTISKDYIYTVASLNYSENYTSAVFKIENDSYITQSESLKNRFFETISKSEGLNFNNLNIRKNILGVPKLFHNNSKLPIQMSLTHCGNYCGYVYF